MPAPADTLQRPREPDYRKDGRPDQEQAAPDTLRFPHGKPLGRKGGLSQRGHPQQDDGRRPYHCRSPLQGCSIGHSCCDSICCGILLPVFDVSSAGLAHTGADAADVHFQPQIPVEDASDERGYTQNRGLDALDDTGKPATPGAHPYPRAGRPTERQPCADYGQSVCPGA